MRRKLHADTLPRGSSGRWDANLAALHAYVKRHGGRYPVRTSACAEEQSLAAWRATQRQMRRGTKGSGVLSAAQVRRLEGVPGWTWEELEHSVNVDQAEGRSSSERASTTHCAAPAGGSTLLTVVEAAACHTIASKRYDHLRKLARHFPQIAPWY